MKSPSDEGEISILVWILIYYGIDSCDFWYSTNVLSAAMSMGIFTSVYGYRPFVNPIWLPLNISLIK